ncbi:MAG: hypothetical protein SAL07_01410 [Oscillatoria sp. PMC 1051.18]|nr:hypothetical protein [Oscillatoria sp. PMC 1050.18]MEC5028541.1 hypothetical protein [Oscillatoria sp. PMC 1051.18]
MEIKHLPDGLNENPQLIKEAVKVWSQFVAWSWTEFLAFRDKDTPDEVKAEQERKLKEFFIKIHQDQARSSYAINSYEDQDQKPDAYAASITIKKLLMGKNNEINELTGVTLTLQEVYNKLTGQNPDIFSDETFMQQFHLEIVTDRFSGEVRDISEPEKNEIIEVIRNIQKEDLKYVEGVEYISYLAYPPCPIFGKTTVTETRLNQWIQNLDQNDQPTADYLPPSAYMPISLS